MKITDFWGNLTEISAWEELLRIDELTPTFSSSAERWKCPCRCGSFVKKRTCTYQRSFMDFCLFSKFLTAKLLKWHASMPVISYCSTHQLVRLHTYLFSLLKEYVQLCTMWHVRFKARTNHVPLLWSSQKGEHRPNTTSKWSRSNTDDDCFLF